MTVLSQYRIYLMYPGRDCHGSYPASTCTRSLAYKDAVRPYRGMYPVGTRNE